MKGRFTLLAAAAVLVANVPAPDARRSAVMHATGSFEVTVTPEAQAASSDGGLPTSRMAIAKTFVGGLSGRATGVMLAAGAPAPGNAAAYVAVDQFNGTLDGRAGGFVLLHRGTMTRDGASDLSVTVAPDTGTGALEGLEGTLTIRIENGRHFYDFAYTLPERR
jgi:hypothetical protein